MSSLCPEQLSGFAFTTWQNLGSPAGISVPYIALWYSSSGNLARINNTLGLCSYLSGSQNCIVGLDDDAMAIYEMIYTQNYLGQASTSLVTSVLCGGTTNTWTELSEGDSRIRRVSPAESMKALNQTIAENNRQLRLAVGAWKLNHTAPATVDAAQLASAPTP